MKCPNCGSENVNIQMVTDTEIKNKHHSVIWWIFVGWWWIPFKWLFLTLPALIVKIFAPKRQKVKQTHRKVCICQNCGHSWEI